MHPPDTRARCSLHLLLVGRDGGVPDPTGLLAVLGDRSTSVTVEVWSPDGQPLAETVRCAADLLDGIERATGTRPRYRELDGDLTTAIRRLTGPPARSSLVALSARAPRRVVRALRRALAANDVHLALLPSRPIPTDRSVPT